MKGLIPFVKGEARALYFTKVMMSTHWQRLQKGNNSTGACET